MATVIDKTIDAAGAGPDNYTTWALAFAALPSSLVADDEQWNFVAYEKASGYAEGLDLPSVTCDATRYVNVTCNPGDEYDNVTDTGVFLVATRNFDGVISNNGIPFLRIDGVGFKNTGTSSARGFLSSQDNCQYTNMYATTDDNYQVVDITAGDTCNMDNVLAEGGTIGFNFGSFAEIDCTNLTTIDPSSTGYSKTGASRVTELVNCLHIDGAGGGSVWGSGTFAGATDYNATSDSTTPTGANSLANRTTSDLVNYAGSDFRTAAASALATAGSGGTFIGYALEVSAGITIEESAETISVTTNDPSIDLTGVITIIETSELVSSVSLNPSIDLTASITIVESLEVIGALSLNPTITLTPPSTIVVVESSNQINLQSLDPSILLSGTITIVESGESVEVRSNNPIIQVGAIETTNSFIGYVQPENAFKGSEKSLTFSGQSYLTPNFSGGVKQLQFSGIIRKDKTFKGVIQ